MAKLPAASPSFSLLDLVAAMAIAAGTCAAGDRTCWDYVADVAMYCENYLVCSAEPKTAPSETCCRAVGNVVIPCLCSFVDDRFDKGMCMEKLVYVFDYCKNPLRPGCKCGSYTVPPLLGLEENEC